MEKLQKILNKIQDFIDRARPSGGWLSSKKLMMALSLIISIACWVFITLHVNADSQTTITDVPIRIDTTAMYESFGLEMIAITGPEAISDGKVDVVVTGSAFQISRVTADDITVAAQTGSVNKAGKYPLSLVLSCGNRDVTVAMKDSYKTVDVWFDSIMEKTITLEKPLVTGMSVPADSGLIIGEPTGVLKTIDISGPESVVDRVASVQLRGVLERELTSTTAVEGTLCYLDENGELLGEELTSYISILDYNGLEAVDGVAAGAPSPSECVISVPIRTECELTIQPTFRNAPEGFDVSSLKYTVTPSTIRLEGDIDVMKKYSEDGVYSLDGIDLSTVVPGASTFVVKLNLSSAVSSLDGVSEVQVVVNMKGYEKRTVTVDGGQITLLNAEGRSVSVASEALDVVVVGPTWVVDELTGGDIAVTVDMSEDEWTAGVREKNAAVTVGDGSRCWTVGTYTVKVKVD